MNIAEITSQNRVSNTEAHDVHFGSKIQISLEVMDICRIYIRFQPNKQYYLYNPMLHVKRPINCSYFELRYQVETHVHTYLLDNLFSLVIYIQLLQSLIPIHTN